MSLGKSSSSKKPRLMILPYGGTIMSEQMENAKGEKEWVPSLNTLPVLQEAVSKYIWKKFRDCTIFATEAELHHGQSSKRLFDSAQARATKHIQSITEELRELLRADVADVFVLLYGTDTITDLTTVIGNSVSTEELGHRGVIVTGAIHAPAIENSDAPINFRHSVELGYQSEIRGRIGLCMSRRFWPPRGIEKVQLSAEAPVVSRFRRQAKHNGRRWLFDREIADYDLPRGEANKSCVLTEGIGSFKIGPMMDLATLPTLVERNKATVIEGLGDGNLRWEGEEELDYYRQAAQVAKGPIVVVGSALYNKDVADGAKTAPFAGTKYVGNVAKFPEDLQKVFFSGGAMTSTEVTAFLSQFLGQCGDLPKEEICARFERALAAYPFLSGDPTHIAARRAKKERKKKRGAKDSRGDGPQKKRA